MSKHFELMQQMEANHVASSASAAAPLFSHGDKGKRADRTRWAHDEALRLVQQIFLLQAQEPPRVVVFAGVDHGNGSSQISASVAEILAKNARRPVCLVEANFRSPGLSELFGTNHQQGLTDSLLHKGPIGSFADRLHDQNLWLLSSGKLAADSPSLLSSDVAGERIDELRIGFEFVIIDGPPLSKYSDAIVLGQRADGLVLILEADATRREAATAVVDNLRSMKIPILAAVLNKRTFPIPEKIYRRL